MLKTLKQARAAFSLLNPDEIRKRATRPVQVGVVGTHPDGFEMVESMLAEGAAGREREDLLRNVHRAGDPNAPSEVDFVLYQPGLPPGEGAYSVDLDNPESTIRAILHGHADFGLPLARQFPAFRKPYVDQLINTVARENALFAIATALPNVLPSLVELPWAFGEFATDTAFLTANQIRMAFLIGAACGKDVGFAAQKVEVLTIAGGAFGWRALARELAGKIPLGGGLIPKGAIAYAGTVAVGKGLEYYHEANRHFTPEEREAVYREAYVRGQGVAESLSENRS
jgi:hypothetical protein